MFSEIGRTIMLAREKDRGTESKFHNRQFQRNGL